MSSEFRAYHFIKLQLENRGWNFLNPSENPNGEVYTQNECLSNPFLKKKLGKQRPENVVKIDGSNFYIIEAKNEYKKIEEAKNQAENYCRQIGNRAPFYAVVVDDGTNSENYTIRNFYNYKDQFVEVKRNGQTLTTFLNRNQIKDILNRNDPNLDDEIIISEEKIFKIASSVNKLLHSININRNKRARVIATILLALTKKSNFSEDSYTALIDEINSRAKSVLKEKRKGHFSDFIKIEQIEQEENHKNAFGVLIQVIEELNKELNIKQLINSSHDVLGNFYENFLKYGNGAKDIGIVLTPRHITKLSVELLEVNINDRIFDPCCGTGGFLIAALDRVKRKSNNENQISNFKSNNLYGIDIDQDVFALAIVNMIFRGDGNTHLKSGDCFAEETYREFDNTKFTKILMNPPFNPKTDKKTYQFIDKALKSCEIDGELLAIVPLSVLADKELNDKFKKPMLEKNTLIGIISLPENLFSPIAGGSTSMIILKSGTAHDYNKEIFFAKLDDGYKVKNSTRNYLRPEDDNTEKILRAFEDFRRGHPFNKNNNCFTKKINIDDLDLSYENNVEIDYEDILSDKNILLEMQNVILNLISCEINKDRINNNRFNGGGGNVNKIMEDKMEIEINKKIIGMLRPENHE